MPDKKNRCLVTGGCGFIGSNLVIELLKQGYIVDVFDDMSNGRLEFLAVEKMSIGDDPPSNLIRHVNFIFEKEKALAAVSSASYDKVFHFAANPRPALSIEDPIKSYNDNVLLSLEFLDACKKSALLLGRQTTDFIFASSSAVYGEGLKDTPISESDVCTPVSPYGLEKKNVEEMMRIYSKEFGLNSVALRFFNVYGKNQLVSPKYPCVIAAWMKKMLNNEKIQMYGSGSMSRDFVDVESAVKATVSAAQLLEEKRGHRVFNIGSGTTYSLTEVFDEMTAVTKSNSTRTILTEYRPGDVQKTHARVIRMTDELGVKSLPLDEGLQRTFEWAKESWIFKNLKINV